LRIDVTPMVQGGHQTRSFYLANTLDFP